MNRPVSRPRSRCDTRPLRKRPGLEPEDPALKGLGLEWLVAGLAPREEAIARARHHLGSLGPEVAEQVACALVDCLLAGDLP